MYDFVIIHYYPDSPFIVECALNFKSNGKIRQRIAMKNLYATQMYLNSRFPGIKQKTIIQNDFAVKKIKGE